MSRTQKGAWNSDSLEADSAMVIRGWKSTNGFSFKTRDIMLGPMQGKELEVRTLKLELSKSGILSEKIGYNKIYQNR